MKKEITIDAKNKKLGRLASEVAKTLRGKTEADFLPNRTTFPMVTVKNVDEIEFNEAKMKNTFFQRYSGYPGGRKVFSAWDVAQKDKRDVLKHAVWGMLHKNRLKKEIIKNLILLHGNDK
jgi:large subunit ribosomal protein L13